MLEREIEAGERLSIHPCQRDNVFSIIHGEGEFVWNDFYCSSQWVSTSTLALLLLRDIILKVSR